MLRFLASFMRLLQPIVLYEYDPLTGEVHTGNFPATSPRAREPRSPETTRRAMPDCPEGFVPQVQPGTNIPTGQCVDLRPGSERGKQLRGALDTTKKKQQDCVSQGMVLKHVGGGRTRCVPPETPAEERTFQRQRQEFSPPRQPAATGGGGGAPAVPTYTPAERDMSALPGAWKQSGPAPGPWQQGGPRPDPWQQTRAAPGGWQQGAQAPAPWQQQAAAPGRFNLTESPYADLPAQTADEARAAALEQLDVGRPQMVRPAAYQRLSMGDVLSDPRYVEAERRQTEQARAAAAASGVGGAGLIAGLGRAQRGLMTGLHGAFTREGIQAHAADVQAAEAANRAAMQDWQAAYQPRLAALAAGERAEQRGHGRWLGEQGLGLRAQGQQFGQWLGAEQLGQRGQQQQYGQWLGAEQLGQRGQALGHQQWATEQGLGQRGQAQQFGQWLGAEQLGQRGQAQQFGQWLGAEQLGQRGQAQAWQQQWAPYQLHSQQDFQAREAERGRQFQAGQAAAGRAAADRRFQQAQGWNLITGLLNQPVYQQTPFQGVIG